MPLETCLAQFESLPVQIHPLQPPMLGIVTSAHDVYLYNTQTLAKEKLLRLNVPEEVGLIYAFDALSMRLLFGLKEGKSLHMIDLTHKKLVSRFELDQQSPTVLSFSPDGAYFVCGTDQGRVLLWRCDSITLVARLHSFPEYTSLYVRPKINYVSALTFEGKRLATSGYGGSIVVTDYMSQKKTKRLHPGNMKINLLLFYKNSLIAGTEEGVLLKIDRSGKFPNQRLPLAQGPLRYLLRIKEGPYAVAACEHESVSLINLDTMKTVHEHYIRLDTPIVSLCKDEEEILWIATRSGKLHRCDLFPVDVLESLVEAGSYAEAYRYCLQEPLLEGTPPHQKLEEIFHDTLEKARQALENAQNDEATALLEPFRPAKGEEVAALTGAFSYLKRFAFLFERQKLAPFYGLAEQHPPLQSAALFRQAEQLWSERFSKAQKFMLLGKVKEAQEAVAPFAAVNSKRPLVQLLIHHLDVLRIYSKAVHERDYSRLAELTRRHPALRRLPSYAQISELAGEHSNAIIEALNAQAFEEARTLLEKMRMIEEHEEEYHRLKLFFSIASNLDHAVGNKQWRSAYQLLDIHPELMILPWAQKLETKWDEKLQRCETHAIAGDVPAITAELGNLITLPGRHERIGDLLRMAYQVQLARLLPENPSLFAAGAENYCDLFGIDTELRQLLKKARRQKVPVDIDPLRLHPKKRDHWLQSARILPEHIA